MLFRVVTGLSLLMMLKAEAASHHPQEILKMLRGSPKEGAAIVKLFCASCHSPKPLIELGAPKMHQAKDWSPRIQQGGDVLLKHTQEGFGAMPARGGCFECTDKQLELAIAALLAK